jgi:threonine dehydrogenase-like Zn-dependent dehydrogenase
MTIPSTTRAAVTTSPGVVEVQELPIPSIDTDGGLLEVEAAGICGSDVKGLKKELPARVMGHENVGRVVALGEIARGRWGLTEGDRILIEEYLPCGHCRFCRSAEFRYCVTTDPTVSKTPMRYGTTGLEVGKGLWGGFSEYMYLHPNTVFHHVPEDASAVELSLALPIANGYEWAYEAAGAAPGKVVVIFGPGQQGLGGVIAASMAGASVVVVGLPRDRVRLDAAMTLGATRALVAGEDDIRAVVDGLTDGRGADAVVDCAAGDENTLPLAVDLLTKQGNLVVAARSPQKEIAFPMSLAAQKALHIKGMRGHSFGAVEWAIRLIGSKRAPLEVMTSVRASLSEVKEAIDGTGGAGPVPVIHAVVLPRGAGEKAGNP